MQIGTGVAAFTAGADGSEAMAAVSHRLGGGISETTPIRIGQSVAIIAKTFGIWSLNACRIVYVIDENGPQYRFGFAYGTLDHMAKGEEKFLVEIDAAGNVWYQIYAFSRPSHPLTKLGLPIFRQVQHVFVRHSQRVMQEIGRAAQ